MYIVHKAKGKLIFDNVYYIKESFFYPPEREMSVARRNMATPSKSKRDAKKKSQKSKSKKTDFNFKRALFSTALWGLGIINIILIFSFVSKHFLNSTQHSISVEESVEISSEEVVQIEVLNACGVNGLARKYADILKVHGYDPVNVTNFDSNSNLPRTYIIDRRSNAMSYGSQIAHILGLPNEYVSYQASPDRMVAVSLILGQDYEHIPANP